MNAGTNYTACQRDYLTFIQPEQTKWVSLLVAVWTPLKWSYVILTICLRSEAQFRKSFALTIVFIKIVFWALSCLCFINRTKGIFSHRVMNNYSYQKK